MIYVAIFAYTAVIYYIGVAFGRLSVKIDMERRNNGR